MNPKFTIEYLPATGELMFDATYPAGCRHRTSMDRADLLTLIRQAKEAYSRSVA